MKIEIIFLNPREYFSGNAAEIAREIEYRMKTYGNCDYQIVPTIPFLYSIGE